MMKQKRLRETLVGCTALFMLAINGVSAHAQGGWVTSAIIYSPPSATITPTGGDVGAGGFCYNTGSVISTALINTDGVEGDASYGAYQYAYWTGSDVSTSIVVNLSANASGTYEEGATDDTQVNSDATASCSGYSVIAHGSQSYPVPYADHPRGRRVLLNAAGGASSFHWDTSSSCGSINKGAYSYGEANATFTDGEEEARLQIYSPLSGKVRMALNKLSSKVGKRLASQKVLPRSL